MRLDGKNKALKLASIHTFCNSFISLTEYSIEPVLLLLQPVHLGSSNAVSRRRGLFLDTSAGYRGPEMESGTVPVSGYSFRHPRWQISSVVLNFIVKILNELHS